MNLMLEVYIRSYVQEHEQKNHRNWFILSLESICECNLKRSSKSTCHYQSSLHCIEPNELGHLIIKFNIEPIFVPILVFVEHIISMKSRQ